MTSTAFVASSPVSPASVVQGARSELFELDEVLWAAKGPGELLETEKQLAALKAKVESLELRVATEIEATKAAAQDGWGSTKDYLTAISGGHRGYGGATLRLGKALEQEFSGVRDALSMGSISRTQAEVIVAALDKLPSNRELRFRAETVMLEHARTLDATDLAKAGKRLVELVDPDGDERRDEKKLAKAERAAHYGRFLAIRDDGAGGVWIRGRATVEDAAVIKSALFPLAAPVTGPAGSCGGAGSCRENGCAHDGRDPREHGARFLDALVEGCRRLMGAKVLPKSHGTTPRLSITMSHTDLVNQVGEGLLDTGQSLSASAVRRLACDADIIPIVLGSQGEVLDVGRTQRLVTIAIWEALEVRDKHCTFPGCRRPPIACDAHHIIHWLDGGGTGLDNLALLCRAHHMMIHNTPWEIRLNPVDRRPEFLPPARLDPERKPIRDRHPRE